MASAALLCVWPYHFIISCFPTFDFPPAFCLDTCFVVEKSNLNPNSNHSRDKNGLCSSNIFGVGGPHSYIIIHILWCYGRVMGSSVWLLGVDIGAELYSGRPFTCSLVNNDIINLKQLLLEALPSRSIPKWSFLILLILTCYLTWLEGFS